MSAARAVRVLVAMVVGLVTVGLVSPSTRGQPPEPPSPQELSRIAREHVATHPAGSTNAAAAAGLETEAMQVLLPSGGTATREIRRWVTPPNMTSMAWEGGHAARYAEPGDQPAGDYSYPQGYRANIGLLGAWVPPTLFPRGETLEAGSEPLLPGGMRAAPTGWQGHSRATFRGIVDLMTGTPLTQVTDLELPVGEATFRLTRTRSALHGSTFSTIGSDNVNKFAFDATDRVWDWLGAGWMVGENPILLIDDSRPDLVGRNPPTCWLILDAHRAIPFQWIEDLQRYEAPPRFRATLQYTKTVGTDGRFTSGDYGPRTTPLPEEPPAGFDPLADHRHGWRSPPVEMKATLYDGALTYTFAVVWEDVPPNRWKPYDLLGVGGENNWLASSLHDRPFLPDYFRSDVDSSSPGANLEMWRRTIMPGLGVPYYGLLTRIEDRDGTSVEMHYADVTQEAMAPDPAGRADSDRSDDIELLQRAWMKGQLSHIVVRERPAAGETTGRVAWTLVYSHRHFIGLNDWHQDSWIPPDLGSPEALAPFFDQNRPESFPWYIFEHAKPPGQASDAFIDRQLLHGTSAIDRIYVFEGSLPVEPPVLSTSPAVAERIEDADDLAELDRPLAESSGLQNWRYCVRYDYNRAPVGGLVPHLQRGRWFDWTDDGNDPEMPWVPAPARAATSPPMLVMTSVFERPAAAAAPACRNRRVFVYDHGPASPDGAIYQRHGMTGYPRHLAHPRLPWLEAIFEDADIARVLKQHSDISLAELALQRHLGIESTEEFPVWLHDGFLGQPPIRSLLLEAASVRLGRSPRGIGTHDLVADASTAGAASWQAPSMSTFWTFTIKYGQYLATGTPAMLGTILADPRAFWDGHDATVGTLSEVGPRGEQFHARIHRFIRTPAALTDIDANRAIFRGTRQHLDHNYTTPPHPSVFVSPFHWHAYQGSLAVGTLEQNKSTTEAPDLTDPRILVVIDEFESRDAMMAGHAWRPPNSEVPIDANPDAYGPADEGGLKSGIKSRTTYELNAWGYVLKTRRWEYRDGGAVVTSKGLGQERIYRSVGDLFTNLPTEGPLAAPSGFARELLTTEVRSIGWSAAEANQPGSGAAKGLVERFHYETVPPSTAEDLERFDWRSRVRLRAQSVSQGTGPGAEHYTRALFYDPQRPPNLAADVRFNLPTSTLPAVPPAFDAPEVLGGGSLEPAYHVTWFTEHYPAPADPRITDRPVWSQRVGPPVRQRPGGAFYYPLQRTYFTESGEAEWHAQGLVLNPADPVAAPAAAGGAESLEVLTLTYTQPGRWGPGAVVIDTEPNPPPAAVQFEQPEAGASQTLNVHWDADRFGPPPQRRSGPRMLPPLHRASVMFYDWRGRLTDRIEPGRRWAIRHVIDYGDVTTPNDDITWEYEFAGLHNPGPDETDQSIWTYLAGDTGFVRKLEGAGPDAVLVEEHKVRFLGRVPILPTLNTRPLLDTGYQPLKLIAYSLDATGRPFKADDTEFTYNQLGQRTEHGLGDRGVNDLGEVYRVWEYGGNIQRWTRNYLGHRLRRYEGVADMQWINEGRDPFRAGLHPYDSNLPCYDMILKDRTTYGEDHTSVWQPVAERRYLRHVEWAHTPSNGERGYHGRPPTFDDAAYVTRHEYDWRMRRVRTDDFELGDPDQPPPSSTPNTPPPNLRARTVIRYLDFRGREAMTAEYGPLVPVLPPALDPAKFAPDTPVPAAAEILALSPRPVSLVVRRFDAGDRPIETRDYDTSAPAGTTRFTRSFACFGPGGEETFSLSPGSTATITTTDGLGRTVNVASVVQVGGQWSHELERSDLTLDHDGRTLEEVRWERILPSGATLDVSNAVPTRTWMWYDYQGRQTAEAVVGTGAVDAAGLPVYRAPTTSPTRPAAGPTLSVSGVFQSVAGLPAHARVSTSAYDDAGRLVASRSPDGVVTTHQYRGTRLLATHVNPSGSDDQTRRLDLELFDSKVVGHSITGAIGERIPESSRTAASTAFGAPVVDDAFVVRSYDRTKPRYMRRDGSGSISATTSWEFEFAYDFVGRLAQRIAADGTVTRYTYAALGELRTIEIGRMVGGVFTPGYPPLEIGVAAADRIGFVEFKTDWTVDATGAPLQTKDIIARVARHAPGGSGLPTGRIVSHVRQNFDGRGRLLSEQQSLGELAGIATPTIFYTWSYTHAADADLSTGTVRLASIKYPAVGGQFGREVEFTYGESSSVDHALDRITRVRTRSAPDRPWITLAEHEFSGIARRVLTHLGTGAMTSLRAPAGVAGLDGVDGFGRTRRTTYTASPTGAVLYDASYRFDAMDRIASVATSYGVAPPINPSRSFGYDALGRLTQADVGRLVPTGAPGGLMVDPSETFRADRWHMDVADNWSMEDPNVGLGADGPGGRVTTGNLDGYGLPWAALEATSETNSSFFRYGTTPSSDLALLRNGIDGTVDPPVTTQRGGLGRTMTDARYWYAYDAWGRLTQVNKTGFGPTGEPKPAELVRHFVYDGLGRLVRVQRSVPSLGEAFVSSEHLFYDGARRIVDLQTAPVYNRKAAEASGDPTINLGAGQSGQEAGEGEGGEQTANTGLENIQVEGEDTRLAVEHVWDPEGSVDDLVAYFDGNDRDRPYWVIQDLVGDPVAVLDRSGPTQPAHVAWRGGLEPYGGVAWAERPPGTPYSPPLRIGHKGLFVERLDADPLVWDWSEPEERLAPGVVGGEQPDILILARNRVLSPRLGRYLQPDPNGTGVAVQASLGWGGVAVGVDPPTVGLSAWAADGVGAVAYCGGDPVNHGDPTGLFFGPTTTLEIATDHTQEILSTAVSTLDYAYRFFSDYTLNTMMDHEWALDWSQADDFYSSSASAAMGVGSWGPAVGPTTGADGPIMAGSSPDWKDSDAAARVVKSMLRDVTGRGVYVIVDDAGRVLYAGRSSDLAKRMASQLSHFKSLTKNPTLRVIGLSIEGQGAKSAVRGLEQLLISSYSLITTGHNLINGISPKNKRAKEYYDAMRRLFPSV